MTFTAVFEDPKAIKASIVFEDTNEDAVDLSSETINYTIEPGGEVDVTVDDIISHFEDKKFTFNDKDEIPAKIVNPSDNKDQVFTVHLDHKITTIPHFHKNHSLYL